MRESDRQKGREICAGTVTNKSLQHDRRLLKHFISPQHNGVLLPIICSVSARVDIKWGAAAFSCHFSAVSLLPWRHGCFLMNLAASRGVHAHEGEAGAPQSSGSKGPRQTVEEHKQGEGRSLVPKHYRDSHFKNSLNMQRGPQLSTQTLLWLSRILATAPSSLCPFPFPTPSVP